MSVSGDLKVREEELTFAAVERIRNRLHVIEPGRAEIRDRHLAEATLYLDIETVPGLAGFYDRYNKYPIPMDHVEEEVAIAGVGAQWAGKRQFTFLRGDQHEAMVRGTWQLLDAAHQVVTYNGDGFDLKKLDLEFLVYGLGPPSYHKSLDLYKIVRRFDFTSKRLGDVCEKLGLGSKLEVDIYDLALRAARDGDERAWRQIQRYCKQDVALLPALHEHLRGWL